jgi:hypothetical protein
VTADDRGGERRCGRRITSDPGDRHPRQGRLRQALRQEDAAHRRRADERPRGAVLRRARDRGQPRADRSRERILRPAGKPRVRALPRHREHRPHPNKGEEPADRGICECFHKTLLDELYRVALRRRLYRTIAELQADLDLWLVEYNEVRTHQGRCCYGRRGPQG